MVQRPNMLWWHRVALGFVWLGMCLLLAAILDYLLSPT